jgi:hypothetical protein
MTSMFTNDVLNNFLDNDDIKSIHEYLDASINEINERSTGYDEETDYDLVNDAYIFNAFINEKNEMYLDNLTNIANSIKDSNIDGISSAEDYARVKEKSELLESNNNNNMRYFIENYLYLIIKVIMIMVLIYVLVSLSKISIFSVSIGTVLTNVYKKISNASSSVKENLSQIKENIKAPKQPKDNKNIKNDKAMNDVMRNFENSNINGESKKPFNETSKKQNNEPKMVEGTRRVNNLDMTMATPEGTTNNKEE